MTRVQGTVTRLEGDQAVVEVMRSSGCGRCHEPGGCGGTTLATATGCPASYHLSNHIGAQVGDKVWLVAAEGSVLKAALWAYGLPGGLMLVGGALTMALTASDLAAFGGALAGLAVGFFLLRRIQPESQGTDGVQALSMVSDQ